MCSRAWNASSSGECSYRQPRDFRSGFSLVELMVVIVIIGLLAGIVTVSVRSYLVAGKQSVARTEMAKIAQALETFYTAYDRYPTNEEGLAILAQPSERFTDGILTRLPKDPWGSPYQYNFPGRRGRFEILCLGADRREGGQGADQDLLHDAESTKP